MDQFTCDTRVVGNLLHDFEVRRRLRPDQLSVLIYGFQSDAWFDDEGLERRSYRDRRDFRMERLCQRNALTHSFMRKLRTICCD